MIKQRVWQAECGCVVIDYIPEDPHLGLSPPERLRVMGYRAAAKWLCGKKTGFFLMDDEGNQKEPVWNWRP